MPEDKIYEVQQGDSAESIAAENGLLLETIWNYPRNAELKNLRKDPHVLMPGDKLVIPALQIKQSPAAVDKMHRFVRKGIPSKLRLVILENDKPRANEKYVLIVDGTSFQGVTGADGSVEKPIPPTAKAGKLIISPGTENERTFEMKLGGLDPITEISGVQGRLFNLGFPIQSVSGELDEQTIEVVKIFQEKYKLTVNGVIDDATRNKLKEIHGN